MMPSNDFFSLPPALPLSLDVIPGYLAVALYFFLNHAHMSHSFNMVIKYIVRFTQIPESCDFKVEGNAFCTEEFMYGNNGNNFKRLYFL